MCGIFGYVGSRDDAAAIVLSGLKKLEYRGYDSWGVAVAHGDRVVLDKRIGKIGDAAPDLPASAVGLGHTRWATHGGVTQPNAHPHLDCTGRLALVHNGIVSNYRELRDPLARAGHRFRSQTDTEVVAHLLEDCLRQTPAGPDRLATATMAAFRRLQGLNAIAVLDVSTGQMAAAKSGSPLVVGWSEHGGMLASDYSALLEHTRRVTFVDDGQAVLVTRASSRLFDVESGCELTPEITEVEWEAAAAELSGYPDYMTKEIKEVSYIHAEGFAGGELKHGVIALIEPGTPCLVLAPRDETHDDILAGAMQVKARGALLIGVSPEPHEAFDFWIPVADLGPATAILNAVPAQLLGYYLALLRGHDPDKPRNLAKSVTVK